MSNDELRIWVAVREDLNMPPGKLAAQVGHAVASLIWREGLTSEGVPAYMLNAQPKIIIKAKNAASLRRMEAECLECGLDAYLITDAGRTVFPEPTLTVCGVGPCFASQLPKYVQRMQLL